MKRKDLAYDTQHEVYLNCECGKSKMIFIRHWERIRCVCGRIWFALQPKRNGKLKLFPWAGNGWMPTGWE